MSIHHGSHWLEREDFGRVTVARLKTPKILDDDVIRAVFDPIYALSSVGRNHVVLNLATVDYLPSMALGKLVMLSRRIEVGNGRLALCRLSPAVQEVLETTRLNDLFNIYPTEEEALQSFA
ncbi:MAG TPA: STAS domain-containing protein [Gemmataceae bacterium]|nr:STAS domain-containing protein [Gemmataceae bacterium]